MEGVVFYCDADILSQNMVAPVEAPSLLINLLAVRVHGRTNERRVHPGVCTWSRRESDEDVTCRVTASVANATSNTKSKHTAMHRSSSKEMHGSGN
jgi:hypothetical protein